MNVQLRRGVKILAFFQLRVHFFPLLLRLLFQFLFFSFFSQLSVVARFTVRCACVVQVSVMFVLQGVVYVIVCWLTTAQWLFVLVCVGDPVVTCAVDDVMVERGAVAFGSVTCVVGKCVLWCCC